MGKKKAAALRDRVPDAEVPVVGPREPCPCGSGKKYRNCHGLARRLPTVEVAARPFEGLPGEADWVALRELVPAAHATVRLDAAHGGEQVVVATLLPGAVPALRRSDGRLAIGLQTLSSAPDPSRAAARDLLAAVAAAPGTSIPATELRLADLGATPRLQDVLDGGTGFEVELHDSFDFWAEGLDGSDTTLRQMIDNANTTIAPTRRLAAPEAAYWTVTGGRTFLRWVSTEDENALTGALARLSAAGANTVLADPSVPVEPANRFLGAFRADGLMVPVWELPAGTTAADVERPARALHERIARALADPAPLSPAELRARAGIVSRQLTLR